MNEQLRFDTALFSARVKTKRGNKGLREAAQEITNVSASTLSRIESGKMVDLQTMFNVCQWLGTSTDEFFHTEPVQHSEPLSAYQRIELILRSETKLEESEVQAIITLVIALDNCK